MKGLKNAIRDIKKYVRIMFQGCWLTAKLSFYYKNPLMLPLSFLCMSIFRKLVDKYTKRVKHKEILKRQRAIQREKKGNKKLAKEILEYNEYLKEQLP